MQEVSTGTILGHYRVVRPLGQGGMGVVYEAEDQKLGRSVAIKLLPEATRQDPAALERFWREARTASSLNHAGICTIYELNESGEQPFIVMELLEGSSLDRASFRRPMPYPKLLDFGVQAADALDAAHRKGILHRDIKPGNIFLSPSGQVKILDFGLAKIEEGYGSPNGANGNKANPTLAAPDDMLTSPGSAVGTIAYMSPEQARGETLDARSDVFSLGVVLYELATAQHPFSGSTTAVTFDRILNYAPTAPISLNPELPVELEETLNKTLEKDRDLRCQSAAELRADLKRLQRKSSGGSSARPMSMTAGPAVGSPGSGSGTGSNPSGVAGGSVPASALPSGTAAVPADAKVSGSAGIAATPARKSHTLPIAAVVLVLLAIVGYAAWRLWPRPAPFSSISLSQITNTGTLENVALSGDGKFLAEVKDDNGQRTLWIRNIATNTDTQILAAIPTRYIGLTFSGDSNYLYFTRPSPENIAVSSLFLMPVFGGTPRQIIRDIDSAPSLSPDGSRFVYLRWTPGQKDRYSEIHLADKDGSNDRLIYSSLNAAAPPAWSSQPNQIAWIELSAPTSSVINVFDIASKAKSSIPQPEGAVYDPARLGTDLAWLPDGKHLVVLYRKGHTDRGQIGIVDSANGDFHPLTNDVNAYSQLALSADGKTLATVLTNQDSSLAYYKGDGGAMISSTPLRISPTLVAWIDEDHLVVAAGGAGISKVERASGTVQPIDTGDINVGIFVNTCPSGVILFTGIPKGGGETRLFRMNGDGSGLTQLTNSGVARVPYCSPDSQTAYFNLRDRAAGSASISFWSVPLAGGTPHQELSAVSKANTFILSPDAKLAMVVYVRELERVSGSIVDFNTGRVLRQLPVDLTALGMMSFSGDGKGVVRNVIVNGGNALLYQPIDGSPTHLLVGPTHEDLSAFRWSPSGKLLAVLQQRRSSDVVLIKDVAGSQAH